MGSCGEFSLKYRSMALCTSLRDSSPLVVLVSVSFCDLKVELYTQDLVKFLRRRLFQDILFKMAGSGLAPASEDVRPFTVFVERVERLHMFIHSDRVKVLYCFGLKLPGTWKHRPS